MTPKEKNNLGHGELIYSSPPYPKGKRIIAIILWTLPFFILLTLIARSVQINSWANNTLYQNVYIFAFLVAIFFAVIIICSIIKERILYPHFKLYDNGITKFTMPIFVNRDGDFILFSDMKSFSISKNQKTCAIILHNEESSLIWTSYNPNHIVPIVDALRIHNIPEIGLGEK